MAETRNQTAWARVEERFSFVNAIDKEGFFDIDASAMKEAGGREPRLMAKFDHSVNRPRIFIENGIAILPTGPARYRLLKFNSFQECGSPGPLTHVPLEPVKNFRTIDPERITSEDRALIVCDIAGILRHFTGEGNLSLTNRGKFGTGSFSFRVTSGEKILPVEVDGAGAELDAGYEGDIFYIIEAKIGKTDDFNIRQLYYPYRFWRERVSKKVVPLFLTWSDRVFTVREFAFTEDGNFNSITPVRSAGYVLDSGDRVDLREACDVDEFLPGEVPGVPFPQANDFEKVINIVEILFAGLAETRDDFADHFSFDIRQADYYYNAARYLGLTDSKNGKILLTPRGKEISLMNKSRRHHALIRLVLSRRVFHQVFTMMERGEITADDAAEAMRKNGVLAGRSDSLVRRRAQTVMSWCRWIQGTVESNQLYLF